MNISYFAPNFNCNGVKMYSIQKQTEFIIHFTLNVICKTYFLQKTVHQLDCREPDAATELAAAACPPASPVGSHPHVHVHVQVPLGVAIPPSKRSFMNMLSPPFFSVCFACYTFSHYHYIFR